MEDLLPAHRGLLFGLLFHVRQKKDRTRRSVRDFKLQCNRLQNAALSLHFPLIRALRNHLFELPKHYLLHGQ